MPRFVLSTAFAFIFLLAGCGGTSDEVGETIASEKAVIDEKLNLKTDLHGKRIAVSGYIWMSSSEEKLGEIEIDLRAAPNGEGGHLLDFKVDRGTGANEVEIDTELANRTAYGSAEYDVDLPQAKFTDHAGAQHPWTQKVTISGTVEYVESFEGGFSNIPGPGGAKVYPWNLTDVRLDAAK